MRIWGNTWDHIVFGLIVFGIAFLFGRILRSIIGLGVRAASRKLKVVDHTQFNFLKNSVESIVYVVAMIVFFNSIPQLKVYGTALFAGAGVLAAIVGFASQSAFSNIISGIFIVIFKPFSVGDRVRIAQIYNGDVEDITLRHTIIKDFENRRIVIPNSVISSETIINSTLIDEKVCMFIELNISYGSNVDHAMSIMTDEVLKHPHWIDNRTHEEKTSGVPPVEARLLGFVDYSQQLRAYAWAENPTKGFELKCDVLKSIKERFDLEGIQLAIPYRMVTVLDTPKQKESDPLLKTI
jgi:small conductance mechanosensitive channel